jgi:O-antigen/teichoic acid export membrane protein
MIETSRRAETRRVSPISTSDQDVLLAAKGSGIAFAGNMLASASRFAFGIVLARLLGAELLGQYNLSLTAAQVVGALALLGLSAGMARYIPIAINRNDDALLWGVIQTGVGLPILIGLILASGVFVLSEPLSLRVFGHPDLAPLLRLASLSIPLTALIGVLAAITQGFKRMEYKVYSQDITLNFSKLILSVGLIGLGLSVMGAMIAHILASALTVILLFYFVHRLFSLNRALNTAKRKTGEILRFTLPLYMSGLLDVFSGSLETFVLGIFGVMSGVGIYTSALRLSGIGGMFHQSVQRIAIPMISDLHSRGKLDQLRRVYQTTTKWEMTFNLPIFVTIVIFAKPLLAIFGEDFIAGATGLTILAFSTLFNASTGPCGSIVTMTGRSRLTLANSIVYLVVNVGLDLFFIPRWGMIGAALAVTLTGVLINTLRLTEVFILLRLHPYDRSFLKPIAAALLAAAVTSYSINQWMALNSSMVQAAVGMILLWSIYALAVVLLGLSEEDRLVLNRLWARFNSWRGPKS